MSQSSEQERLDQLKARLDQARKEQDDKALKGKPRGKAMGLAYRMAFELVIAVLVGTYLGWLVDGWLDTTPLFLIVMFLIGAAAGIKNVIRASDQIAAQNNDKGEDES